MLVRVGDHACDFRPWRPADGTVFDKPFALDTETALIIGHEVPDYVLGAACDGERGYYITPERVAAFLRAHPVPRVIMHHSPFDIAVLAKLLRGEQMDVYTLVDGRRVWDTQLLHRLYTLATEGHSCQGPGQSTLDACVRAHLGVELPKDVTDADGQDVRTGWGRWLGRPPSEVPTVYLEYLARDVLATFVVFRRLSIKINQVLHESGDVWGYVDHSWLLDAAVRYGPLTHDLQVMAAVALDAVERAGLGVDAACRDQMCGRMETLCGELRERLRVLGYLDGEKGSDKALQALVAQAVRDARVEVPLTATGKFSTKEEDLEALVPYSEFVSLYKQFREVRSLLNTHLSKLKGDRVRPRYDVLKNTGRTGTSAPNIQGFPKKGLDGLDVRRCFAPPPGKLLYVADYASVELRTLSQAVMTQFRSDSSMARAINAGVDLHRLVAARMKASALTDGAAIVSDPDRLAELMRSLSKKERDAAKPANFGLPAGMGVPALRAYARAQYGVPYTEEDACGWLDAWLVTFPEMNEFRRDDSDPGLALARELGLTTGHFAIATGTQVPYGNAGCRATGWLGGMALKVLKDTSPVTRDGRPYGDAAVSFLWDALQQLAPRLDTKLAADLQTRRPGPKLADAVRDLAGRGPVFTATGRLRARASYTARRNTVFQGLAADGAKLALYRLWRAGLEVVAFIHDEVAVEVDEDADLVAVKQQVDTILISSMREVCPDVVIEVEGGFRRRWGKDPADAVQVPVADVSGGGSPGHEVRHRPPVAVGE